MGCLRERASSFVQMNCSSCSSCSSCARDGAGEGGHGGGEGGGIVRPFYISASTTWVVRAACLCVVKVCLCVVNRVDDVGRARSMSVCCKSLLDFLALLLQKYSSAACLCVVQVCAVHRSSLTHCCFARLGNSATLWPRDLFFPPYFSPPFFFFVRSGVCSRACCMFSSSSSSACALCFTAELILDASSSLARELDRFLVRTRMWDPECKAWERERKRRCGWGCSGSGVVWMLLAAVRLLCHGVQKF